MSVATPALFAALCAIAYGVHYCRQPTTARRSAAKTVAVAGLLIAVWQSGGPNLLMVALGFSALGDFFLSRDGERAFLGGMGAFGAAHLAYLFLFLHLGRADATDGPWSLYAAGLLILATGFYAFLRPGLGSLRYPVLVYTILIAAMGIAALGLDPAGARRMVLAGAILFILSDAVLALEKFRLPVDAPARHVTPHLVWGTYWIAQVLIAAGVVRALTS